jgi:hypothetical protein
MALIDKRSAERRCETIVVVDHEDPPLRAHGRMMAAVPARIEGGGAG